jgi:hypothetical protein
MAGRTFEFVEPIGVIPYSADEPTRRYSPRVHQLLGPNFGEQARREAEKMGVGLASGRQLQDHWTGV